MNDDLKKAIEKSGHNFHFKTAHWLQENGWSVLISPYYSDDVTNKTREVDIVAEKLILNPLIAGKRIKVRLFLECKYLVDKYAFWFHDKDLQQTKQLIGRMSGLIASDTQMLIHHYHRSREVAKLFQRISTSQKGNFENDVVYDAMSKSLKSLIYWRENGLAIINDKSFHHVLNYPVVLFNKADGHLFRVNVDENGQEIIPLGGKFEIEINYAYMQREKPKNEYFLIDVLSFDKLQEFQAELEREAKNVVYER